MLLTDTNFAKEPKMNAWDIYWLFGYGCLAVACFAAFMVRYQAKHGINDNKNK